MTAHGLVHGEAVAIGLALRVPVLGPARASAAGQDAGARRGATARGRPADPHRQVPGGAARTPTPPRRHVPGQEGRARRARPSSWRAASARASSRKDVDAGAGPRLPRRGEEPLSLTDGSSTSIDPWLALADRHLLPGAVGLLLGRRDRADRRPAARACTSWSARATSAPASSTGCSATRERLIGAMLIGNNVVNIGASALAPPRCWRSSSAPAGVRLRHGGDDGAGRRLRRGAAQDRGHQQARPAALLLARPVSWVVALFGPLTMAIEAFVRSAAAPVRRRHRR